jgi:cyclopropane-fatty-acyl-phospholipid synthase
MIGLEKALRFVEKGRAPDWVARKGIQNLIKTRLREEEQGLEENRRYLQDLISQLRNSPIAIHPDKANEQHYELPPEFFQQVLGKHLKYSSCYWPEGVQTLDEAEAAMLRVTAERAQLEDGQTILELGCGWGSLTLWMAEHFPSARILAMSNSTSQCEFIEREASQLGFDNVSLVAADINEFETDLRFDRVVSVEMLEHIRNYEALLSRIAGWLRPNGKLFVHIFCHRYLAYPFQTVGADNWMGKYFFTGGMMPSDDLLLYFQSDLSLEDHWRLNGRHYSRTAQEWLKRMDENRKQLDPILSEVYGSQNLARWRTRWRLFFMACQELFGYRAGEEWLVSHYRFVKRTGRGTGPPVHSL